MSKTAQRHAAKRLAEIELTTAKQPSEPNASTDTAEETEDARLLKHEVARYIVQMTNELSGMARSANMELLAYFLDMSRVEANVQLQRTEG